jgi:hypothetical protein
VSGCSLADTEDLYFDDELKTSPFCRSSVSGCSLVDTEDLYFDDMLKTSPFCRSSVSGCSLVDTEDLYFDDELHPSLERDPNMQLLLTASSSQQELSPPLFDNLFDTYDGGGSEIFVHKIFFSFKKS